MRSRPPGVEYLAQAFRLLGIGWYVATSIVLGVLGGWWLDRETGLTPLFTLLGTGLGLAAALYGVYRLLLPLLAGGKGPKRQR